MKKLIAILLAAACLLTLVSCAGNNSSSTPATPGTPAASAAGTTDDAGAAGAQQPDFSQPYELDIYVAYDGAKDLDMVTEEINKITMETMNCTVKFHPIGTADQTTKYNLALATNEKIDLIFAATWFSYADKANNGAFIALEDYIDTYVPEMREIVPQDIWDNCKINGHDYAIPHVVTKAGSAGFLYREDLRAKYGCPEITDRASIEAYCDAIIANEPGLLPMYSHANDMFTIYNSMYHEHTGIGHPYFHFFVCDLDNPRDLHVSADTDNFHDYCTWARSWVEKGYVQSDAVSNTEDHASVMLAGKYASSIFNGAYETLLNTVIEPARVSHPDWEFGYISWAEMFKISMPSVPFQASFAVPTSSQDPVRAIYFMKEVMTNKELATLIDCGIEGVHYEIADDGSYVSLNDPDNPGFVQDCLAFSSTIPDDMRLHPANYTLVKAESDKIMPYAVYNYKEAFPVDIEPVRDYVNALSLVYQQYGYPLVHGQIADVEAGIETFKEKMVEAGAELVYEEYNRQWQEYLDFMGVPAA